MMKIIMFFMLAGISGVIYANPNNPSDPTNGYCQTIDPSACGWGRRAPVEPNHYFAVAIDFSTSKNAVQSWIAPTQRVAENGALKECGKYFDNCQIIASTYKQCIAIARQQEGDRIGFAKGISPYIEEAKSDALHYCRFDGASSTCQIVYSGCSE